jgi:hypothetical protein
LPAGEYIGKLRFTDDFSDKLIIADGVTLIAENPDYSEVIIENASNIAIKGLTVSRNGIAITGSKNIVIIKNIFKNYKVAIYDDGTQTLSIIDNEFDGDDYPVHLKNTKIAIINNNIYKNASGKDKAVLNIDGSAVQIVGDEIPGKGLPFGEVGVDISRLPQIDVNRFVDMPRKTTIDGKNIYDYIITAYNNGADYVIIPPGTYFISGEPFNPHIKFSDMKNFTIYAYGSLFEFEHTNGIAFSFINCENVSLKGLTMDYTQVANPQGTIIDISNGRMTWRADEGYIQDIWDDNLVEYTSFGGNVAEGFRPGCDIPYTDTWSNKNEMIKIGEGLVSIPVKSGLETGGKMIFRGRFAHVNLFSGCTDMKYEDVTVFSGSGFGFMESNGGGNSRLNRVAFTPGPVPKGGTEKRLISTCDATHAVNMREGMKVTNCLFEKMTDDATNNCGSYGTITEFNSDTKELTYKGGNTFRQGDRALIYTLDGKLLCDTAISSVSPIISAGDKNVRIDRKAIKNITLGKSFDYDAEVTTIIENASSNGNNFLYDNCLVQNNRSRGFLIKSPYGVITNCTLKDNGMSSILISPEIADNWGECGFTWDLKITNNKIIDGGFFTGSELHSPINITGDKFPQKDSSYYNHGNILIQNNSFEGRYSKYCINANSIDGLNIIGNTFGGVNTSVKDPQSSFNRFKPDEAKELALLNDTHPVINIQGARNIEISGNTYPENNLQKINIGKYVSNISGTDI